MKRSFLDALDHDECYPRSSPTCSVRFGVSGLNKLTTTASELEIPRATLARRLVIKGLLELDLEKLASK